MSVEDGSGAAHLLQKRESGVFSAWDLGHFMAFFPLPPAWSKNSTAEEAKSNKKHGKPSIPLARKNEL
jgi:hypothetical protein